MAISLVRFASNLFSGNVNGNNTDYTNVTSWTPTGTPTHLTAAFDSSNTYVPTVGNLVLLFFKGVLDTGTFTAGWAGATVSASHGGCGFAYKVWTSGDTVGENIAAFTSSFASTNDIIAYEIPNIVASSPIDQVAIGFTSGSHTSPVSCGTGTPNHIAEVPICFIGYWGTSGTPTFDNGFTIDGEMLSGGAFAATASPSVVTSDTTTPITTNATIPSAANTAAFTVFVRIIPSGFQAKLDATGTYQPTIGNLVVFENMNTQTNPPDGWSVIPALQSSGADAKIFYKIWGSGDSTTAYITYTSSPSDYKNNLYQGYEFFGVDPTNPIEAASKTLANFFLGVAPITLDAITITDAGCAAITLFASELYAASPTTPTESGFSYDGFISDDGSGIAPGDPHAIFAAGTFLSLSALGISTGSLAPVITVGSEFNHSGFINVSLFALKPGSGTPSSGTAETIQAAQIVLARSSSNSLPNPAPAWPTPLSEILKAYPYVQYQDDPNIVAWFTAYNQIAQSYLDWFSQTPFALYTNPNVNGQLLDWVGQGIYGIPRPVFSTLAKHIIVANIDGVALDTMEIDGSSFFETGTAVTANDDFYKRVITWLTYIGDGRMTNASVIRKRVARFLYGVNGTDITATQAQNVSVTVVTSPSLSYAITVPSSANPASTYFQDAFNSGILSFPFQLQASVAIV